MSSATDKRERAVLVAVDGRHGEKPILRAEDSLAELARLAATAGLTVAARVIQTVARPHPGTFIGSGKVEEVRALAGDVSAQTVIFDDELSPAQQRNLEQRLCVKVVDRTQLILDIFAQRATSQAGKLQVELAQLQYLLPRLTRQWAHLSRQGAGVGMRGPGETQLEVDRRRVRERIATLRKRLRKVERTRDLHRGKRSSVPYPAVALVGYTNSGKSTLMNSLTDAGVVAVNKLFATLDPTVRLLKLPEGGQAILVDTVGFINKFPLGLVDGFKSTLEEVRTADLLLHVVDASDPLASEEMTAVEAVLGELGVTNTPRITVLNKSDLISGDDVVLPVSGPRVRISARTGDGLDDLLRQVGIVLASKQEKLQVMIPVARTDLLAQLHRAGKVTREVLEADSYAVTAYVPANVAGRIRKALATAC